ncbi:MAG: hypothetical protein ACJARS_001676 [bacterium]
MTHFRSLLLIAVVVTAACGDSFVSGASLDGLLGTTAPTADAVWEYRWGTEGGLVVGCDFVDANVGEDIAVVVGQVKLLPPVVSAADVPVWQQLDGAEFAVLLPVLVEPEVYEPIREVDDELSLDVAEGVWGITAPMAMVVARGDLGDVSDHLVFDGAPDLEFDGDVAWVEVISEVVELRGTLAGALAPMSREDREDVEEEGLAVTGVDFALSDAAEAWSGGTLGGVTPAENCQREFDDEDDE